MAAQQWIVNGYLLTLGSLILIGGSLGDMFGERRVFALGVAFFGVASVLCAAAPSIGLLVAARGLQGIAGALLVPSSLAVIVNTFPPEERGAAIGSWTAWGAIFGVLPPLLASLTFHTERIGYSSSTAASTKALYALIQYARACSRVGKRSGVVSGLAVANCATKRVRWSRIEGCPIHQSK